MKKQTLLHLFHSKLLTAIPFILSAIFLAGCGSTEHYKSVERGAVRYYAKKYGESVTVKESFVAGNSSLFGYFGVKDRAYEMSDGTNIYWNDSEGYYADDKQAEEISIALREQIMEPALAELGENKDLKEYSFNRTGMESFDKCVFRNYYEGDIFSYTTVEEIHISDFSVAIPEADFKEKAESFLDAVNPYFFESWGTLVVVSENYTGELQLDAFPNPQGDPNVRAVGSIRFGESGEDEKSIRWIENIYVEIFPGVKVSSDVYDFVLEPGDITFEKVGTAADLQKMLDDSYYALPEEAEENKKGGYTVRDQKHEDRTILLNTDAPIYQLQYSERVKEKLDSYEKFSFFLMMDKPEGETLWYYTNEPPYTYKIFRVAESGESQRSYENMKEGVLLYFGEVEWE